MTELNLAPKVVLIKKATPKIIMFTIELTDNTKSYNIPSIGTAKVVYYECMPPRCVIYCSNQDDLAYYVQFLNDKNIKYEISTNITPATPNEYTLEWPRGKISGAFLNDDKIKISHYLYGIDADGQLTMSNQMQIVKVGSKYYDFNDNVRTIYLPATGEYLDPKKFTKDDPLILNPYYNYHLISHYNSQLVSYVSEP